MSKSKISKRPSQNRERLKSIKLLINSLFGLTTAEEEFEVEKQLDEIPLYRDAREGIIDFLIEEGKSSFERKLQSRDYTINILEYAQDAAKNDPEIDKMIGDCFRTQSSDTYLTDILKDN
ncbi:MAG: hypothetical protein AAFV78_00345 [Bacteroidota bacterium]